MSIITNYSTLQQAIADYLARSDLTTFLPNFTQACEMRLYRDLRIRAMETALNVTISGGVAAVPTSPIFLDLKYAYVNTVPIVSLDRVPPDDIYARYPVRQGVSEIPRVIAVEGDNFIFGPYPGDYNVRGIYYTRFAQLSASNTTNWFTTNATDALLYGSLLEAAPFLADDPRVPQWQIAFDRAIASIKKEETRARTSGGSIAARLG